MFRKNPADILVAREGAEDELVLPAIAQSLTRLGLLSMGFQSA
jgi:hypothetical protein